MREPTVSVLTPVYNGEKYLPEMMDSILAQTLQDFEWIIVNDGSTDSTEEIVKSYDDPRIRYFSNDKNRGVAYSFNRAIDLAKGDFLAVAEADDINHPRRLEIQTSYMRFHKNIGLVCSRQKIFHGGKIKFAKIKNFDKIKRPSNEEKNGFLFYGYYILHASTMYRKTTLIEKAIRYNENYKISCDLDMFLRLSRVTDMVKLACRLLYYRIHESNMSREVGETNREANDAYKKFFQKEFGFTMQGRLVMESKKISLSEFNEYKGTIKQILAHTENHPDYDRKLLLPAAANLGYRHLKNTVRGGIDNKKAFYLYLQTPLLRHIDIANKMRLWIKYFAHYLGIKRK